MQSWQKRINCFWRISSCIYRSSLSADCTEFSLTWRGVGEGTMIIAPGRGLIGLGRGESARSYFQRRGEKENMADRIDFCL